MVLGKCEGTINVSRGDAAISSSSFRGFFTGLAAYRGGRFQLDCAEAFEVVLRM